MTVATLATTLRNDLLSTRALGDHEGVGAYTWLCTVWAVLTTGQARRDEAALLALEACADERDAEAERAARHPRYVQRGGDVMDTGAGRWYCTLTAWPHSPAARDGAVLGRAA